MTAPTRVVLGSERLLASGRLHTQRVGIVSNPASVNGRFQHIVQLLANNPDVRLGWAERKIAGALPAPGPIT